MSSEDELFNELRRTPLEEVAKGLDQVAQRAQQQFQNVLYSQIGPFAAKISQSAYDSVLSASKSKYLEDNGWTLDSFNEAYARKMINLAIEDFNGNISALTAIYKKPFVYTPAAISYGDSK